jgi:diaminopimelate epimerase
MCDRHFSVGADGLLLLLPSDVADFKMRVFDADGSEPEACGNGLRCLVRYVLHKGLIDSKTQEVSVETIVGVRKARLNREEGKVTAIQFSMGKPQFKAEDIPVALGQGRSLVDITPIMDYPVTIDNQKLLLSFVSMGNPHAVCFQEQPVADFPLSQIGPKVENNRIFPNRVNFEVARVLDRKRIEARVWERGVGETLACGSGACAIAVLARLRDYIDSKIEVRLPGGTLGVEWNGAGEVFLSGPAEIVFSGEWPDENVKTD